MPLNAKGQKILANMEAEYGDPKKAKSVFYASINAGRITGVGPDSAKKKRVGVRRKKR